LTRRIPEAFRDSFRGARQEEEAIFVVVPADVRVDSPGDGVVVVEFTDEHDLTTKEAVRALLARLIDENDLVVVDVTDAQFIDSSFVHNVLLADQTAKEKGKTFRLQLGTAPIVQCALGMSGILDVISTARSREEAIQVGHDEQASGLPQLGENLQPAIS
jgi:anti-anti-sigma factor